ncbi:hypothetical protein D9611_004126 [Ephemerocybe angulata]|uniref:F-box domain-containing protein n=1 Tax=Ephemerocybe angulata TaxID=980116 RepID=A0A8H5BK92_9AGAR|nr:hypothetical protein D9611_004126 [Tulosesus angulatus]
MSAKLAYQKPSVTLPEIPPEIWIEILRLATDVPDSLEHPQLLVDPKHSCTFRLSGPATRRHKAALITKRYIVLVCREWYAIGMPFLYEHISITRPRHVHQLPETLSKTMTRGEVREPLAFGYFVKRLDMTAMALDPVDWSDEGCGTSLRQVLDLTPNLVTLNMSSTRSLLRQIERIPRAAIPGLRNLNWTRTGISPERGFKLFHTEFLDSHPHIENLDLVSLYLSPHFEDKDPHMWPSIRRLKCFPSSHMIKETSHQFYPGSFPNLEDAFFIVRFDGLAYLNSKFCLAYGRRLKVVHLNDYELWRSSDIMTQDFQSLRDWCPMLEEINFTSPHSSVIPSCAVASTIVLQGIRTVGFHASMYQLSKQQAKAFLRNIISWAQSPATPNARILRLISEENILHPPTHFGGEHPASSDSFRRRTSCICRASMLSSLTHF